MITAGLVFAALAALLHVYIFTMESLTWTSPRTRATFGTTPEEAETTKLLAFNQGFYNLFLAIVGGIGIAEIAMGHRAVGAGRAVVVSDDVGCQADLVQNEVNGFTFPRQNIDALTAVLRRFVDDPSLAQKMGRQSRRIIARFSFDECVHGLRHALAYCVPGFVP